ncbi:hypothetical protein B4U80_01052 [Leptotrombidium deliense]|uniref:Homeobox domain-containing protein n=1 Tax=Leptotrombidium deliense TaxID=299467 RepID=A0A443SN20_9ACAR|nr:hypothetical protein B4U80_01052 [Leptotrombidium deliense]
MKQYYESSLKKYMDELGNNACKELSPELSSNIKAVLEKSLGEAPLDLSKPVDLSKSLNLSKFGEEDTGYLDDARSEGGDLESESDDNMLEGDADCYSNPTSPGPGSTTSSVTSPSISNCQSKNSPSNQANKRYRTQMTTVQLKVMKSIFADYKTPSMAECELLGREVGLPKRVVQVWFQNARAKEKKAKLAFVKTFGQEMPDNLPKAPEECKICNVKYNLKFSSTSMQDHLFSKKHIEALKLHIDSVKKFIEGPDDSSTDFPAASSIVLPPVLQSATHATNNSTNANEETLENRSQSAANLMQQLQMMGLAGLQVPGLQTETVNVNGGTKKKLPESVVKGIKKSTSAEKSKSDATTTNSGSNECDNVANAPYNYVYSGLENYYAAAGATAAFLHPTMYNATASASASGRNKL